MHSRLLNYFLLPEERQLRDSDACDQQQKLLQLLQVLQRRAACVLPASFSGIVAAAQSSNLVY